MERSDVNVATGTLKFYGMSGAYDEALTTALLDRLPKPCECFQTGKENGRFKKPGVALIPNTAGPPPLRYVRGT